MGDDSWLSRVLELTRSLLPPQSSFKRDDPITSCLSRRSELLDFIKSRLANKSAKSAALASKFMRDGDGESTEKSLECYNQCIHHAPGDWPDLPVALAKRSDVLHRMGYLEEAIRDIDNCLLCEASKPFSLYIKKVDCLFALKEFSKTEEMLNDMLKNPEIDNDQKRIVDLMIGKLREEKSKGKNDKQDLKTEMKLPALKGGENPNFPNASNCLEVQYTQDKGRHIVAKCDLNIGDVLIVEKAFSFVVMKSLCSGCCAQLVAPVSCLHCVDAQYCSKECRCNAWKLHHKFECGYLNFFKEVGIGHLALRTLLGYAQSLDDLKKLTNRIESNIKNRNPLTFSKDPYENVYMLISHIDKLCISDLIQYSLTATLLSLYLVHYTGYGTATDENVVLCGATLLRHIAQLVSNTQAISKIEPKCGNGLTTMEEQFEIVGSALYPSFSIMNHSCEPSITYSLDKYYIIVRAWKNVRKGEEVFNSYGVSWRREKKSERQKLLRSQYFFECSCEACSLEHDPYDVMNSLKCEKCNGPVVGENEMSEFNSDSKSQMLICLSCSYQRLDDESMAFQRNEISRLISLGETKLFVNHDIPSALRAFTDAWKRGRQILYKLHKNLSYSAFQLSRCLLLLEDFDRCLAFLKCSVLSVEKRYGRVSMEFAFEAKNLGDTVLLSLSKMCNNERSKWRTVGLKSYSAAEEIVTLSYGSNHPMVQEIQECAFLLRITMPV